MNSDLVFEEKQRFTQWWIRILFSFLNGLFIYALVQQLIFKEPFGNKPMGDLGLVLTAISFLLFTLFFASITLYTTITQTEISVRFSPLHRKPKTFAIDSIAYCYIRRYNPLMEYGGWGLRGWSSDRAYNVSGNMGLQLVFKSGDKLLIGTNSAPQLEQFLLENGINKPLN
jgi:hypothetical protein